MILTRETALRQIADGEAERVDTAFNDGKTWAVLTNYKHQRTDHYPLGDGDLRDFENPLKPV